MRSTDYHAIQRQFSVLFLFDLTIRLTNFGIAPIIGLYCPETADSYGQRRGKTAYFIQLSAIQSVSEPKLKKGSSLLTPCGAGRWEYRSLTVSCTISGGKAEISLHENQLALEGILLRWREDIQGQNLFLNDQWERAYGDL